MMKRWILALFSMVMLLGMTACVVTPDCTEPEITTGVVEESYDLVYDMGNYEFFADIFEEKSLDEWAAMGRYTMLLKGLHIPVVVSMDGTDVLSISAYDHTVELGAAGLADDYHDGFSPVYYIGSTQDAVVIRVSGGESSDTSILITEERYHIPEEGDERDINFYIRDNGALEYYQLWNDTSIFEHLGFNALEYCTDRNEIIHETGSVEIVDGDPVLHVERSVVLSDLFDLDALFAEAKEAGEFEQYDSLDELLAANRSEETQ